MSASFEIRSTINSYRVEIGSGLVDRELAAAKEPIIIADAFFSSELGRIGVPVITIEATETAKSLDRMGEVIIRMRESGATRDTTVIAIGGGVVQDVATFCASIYMRGLPWHYAPTTLLGMVDSCIGGKSSINVGKYKNIVGNFYPPKTVLIEPGFARSLSKEQRVAGLCEAVKICFAKDDEVFSRYLSLTPSSGMDVDGFQRVIELSLSAKKWFIEIDEFDQRERQLLNFGHTFGHALEGASDFALPHGIAVGLGMLIAVEFSGGGGSTTRAGERVGKLVQHVRQLLADVPEIGSILSKIDPDIAIDRFSADKKHSKSHYMVIVPDVTGRLVRTALEKNTANLRLLRAAFSKIIIAG